MDNNSIPHIAKVVDSQRKPLLSVVIPAYNEGEGLRELHSRLSAVLSKLDMESELLFVNDGSTDDTLKVMRSLQSAHSNIAVLDMSRNFGKEIALSAGLDHASGDAVIVIDADLQDPPELIPELVTRWREGYDVVYAKRVERRGETALKRLTAFAFYRTIQKLSRVKIPADTGDYRLLSRRATDALKTIREQHRFMKGLFAWIGFPQSAVPYARDPRFAGETKWNYIRLWNLALEGITSFSTAPLKMATYIGLMISVFAVAYGLWLVARTIFYGNPVPGYPSLMVVSLFLGGVQLFCIGMLGEYLGRVFNETKGRPLYLVNNYAPAQTSAALHELAAKSAISSVTAAIQPTSLISG